MVTFCTYVAVDNDGEETSVDTAMFVFSENSDAADTEV